MERQDDFIPQAIAAELMPSRDRASVIVLFRSSEPIALSTLIGSLKNFTAQLEDKLEKSKPSVIDVVKKPGIVTP